MIYSFSLSSVAVTIGALLFISGILPFLLGARMMQAARNFPRNVAAGVVLMALDLVWATWLATTIDLGEFSSFRSLLVIATIVLGVLMIAFSREFLAVRALSVLLLLAANVILDAAFLRNDGARLVMTTLAYLWITASILFLFSPYRLRDLIAWGTKTESRFKAIGVARIVLGALLLVLGLFIY